MAKTRETTQKHLDGHLVIMTVSAKLYDEGSLEEAINMAVSARALLHNSTKADSLINQLQIKNNIFMLSTTTQYIPGKPGAYYGLLGEIAAEGEESKGNLLPMCQVDEEYVNKWHGVDDWWNELAVNDKAFSLSRKDVVLMIANQNEGTHIDGDNDSNYAALERNSSGWVQTGEQESIFSNHDAYATMRQITFELLKSFEYHYKLKSYSRKAETKLNAIYIDDKVYFASYDCEKYPLTAAALVDPRMSRIEKREVFFDSLINKDGSKNGRIIAI